MSATFEIDDLNAIIYPVCLAAGEATLPYFRGRQPLGLQRKADASPVTQADIDASQIIERALGELPWQLPVISEESEPAPYDLRRHWHRYWLVDPIDGTREFIDGSDEYTVNIALIEDGQPRWGAVYQPVAGAYYWGGGEIGAWLGHKNPRRLRCDDISARLAASEALRVLTSRRHGTAALDRWWTELERLYTARRIACGSSLKFCVIASGGADLYPRFGHTSEWDTAAGQAVLEGAGGAIVSSDGNELAYNRKPSLLNSEFLALGASAGTLLEEALKGWARDTL